MGYAEYKEYVKAKFPGMERDVDFLFASAETIYMNNTSPFDLSAKFDEANERATNWVTRAVMKLCENGEIDILSYSENGLSMAIGATLMSELTCKAGVPQ
jgi:hypothetical protein